jgi:site-specific recombinase XerC
MISLRAERNSCSSEDVTPIRSTAGCHAKDHLSSGHAAESERTDTVATHLLEDGDGSRASQELLGYKDGDTTMVYPRG